MTYPTKLPEAGSVLGIDIGFSPKRRSSSVCRLDWDLHQVTWTIQRFRAIPDDQETVIIGVAGDRMLQAAALHGPLRSRFEVIGCSRTAERMLDRRLASRIGKPGQASAPVGKRLNAAANACARITLQRRRLEAAKHAVRIDDQAFVEAFPSSCLGVMLRDPTTVAARRGDPSDTFFEYLTATGTLQGLLDYLLPGRATALPVNGVKNHDN